jgi:hypothetical protein
LSVHRPDGDEIATLSKSVLRQRFTIVSQGEEIGRFRKATLAEARRESKAATAPTIMQRARQGFVELNHAIAIWCIESENGEVTTRITSVGDSLGRVNCVCELSGSAVENVMLIGLAACIATDNMIKGGGGG